jgi:PAS domain S-box-containing protein
MKKEENITDDGKLRQLAEKGLKEAPAGQDDLSGMSPKDMAGLIHELRVHQIELKMQNEELRRIQGELEDTRDRYSHLYDFAPVGYFTMDQKGLILEVNLAGAGLLGEERSFLIGDRFARYISPDFQDEFYFHRKRVLETRAGQTCELALKKRGEQLFHGRLRSIAYQDPRDNAIVLRTAISDISELKKAEEALRKANRELEERIEEATRDILEKNQQLDNMIEELREAQHHLRKSESRYKALFDYNPIQTMVVDTEGKITDYNLAKKTSGDRLPNAGDIMFKDYAGRYGVTMYEEILKTVQSGSIKNFNELAYGDKVLSLTMAPFSEGVILTTVDITDLKMGEKRIRELTHNLIMAHENERYKISRDLHDQVAQDLSWLRMALETLFDNQPPVSSQIIRKVGAISKSLGNAIQAVRDISYNLRPTEIDEIGLLSAISQHCEDFSENSGIEVDLGFSGTDQLNIDHDTEINLYRIMQEGLNNIWRHADTSHAVVRLKKFYPHILLDIEDKGKGFDVKEIFETMRREKRMGLRSMEERVRLLKGQMKIESQPEKGTKIFIKIPLQEEKSDSKEDHIDH